MLPHDPLRTADPPATPRSFQRSRSVLHGSRLRHPHHPWRAFGRFTDWRLSWTRDLPEGTMGRTLFGERRVLLADWLDQAERRCTIAHETAHILRGPCSPEQRLAEELAVDRRVARLLVPDVERVGHALTWHHAEAEGAADELWVDVQTLDVRLSMLNAAERAWLDEQLATVLV